MTLPDREREAVKACPFCGGKADVCDEQYRGTMASGMETPEPYVRCAAGCVRMKPERCDDTPWGVDHGERSYREARLAALAAWNRRASDAEVERLRGLLADALKLLSNIPTPEADALACRIEAEMEK